MSPLSPILVATDFSAPARHAVQRAARVAHETNAALRLLHVLPGDVLGLLREWLGADNAAESQLLEQSRQQLLRLAQELGSARHVRQVDISAQAGPIVREILAQVPIGQTMDVGAAS